MEGREGEGRAVGRGKKRRGKGESEEERGGDDCIVIAAESTMCLVFFDEISTGSCLTVFYWFSADCSDT